MQSRIRQFFKYCFVFASIVPISSTFAAISNPTVSNDATNIYFSFSDSVVFPYNQVYIDTDINSGTGFSISGIGADRLIENQSIYKSGGTGWSWTKIQDIAYAPSGSTYKWTVPLAALGVSIQCGTPIRFVYRSGGATTGDVSSVINYKLVIGTNCGSSPTPPPPPPPTTGKMPVGTTWNYVLTQAPDLSISVGAYDIDGNDNSASVVASIHAKGRKAICYMSAGTWEDWRPDANKFPASVKGSTNGWPGERWLDIRNLSVLGPIMTARMDECKTKGFDAVEFDNVDGYSNSTGFPLKASDQITYNTFLANEAHKRGLAAGLKNDVDQVQQLQPSFDFAINEQCWQYNECGPYAAFINAGKAVMNVEYSAQPSTYCPKAKAAKIVSIKKKLNLDNSVTFCP